MNGLYKLSFFISLTLLLTACQQSARTEGADEGNDRAAAAARPVRPSRRLPSIEVYPVKPGEGDYKIITGDRFKVSVAARAGAREIQLLYQPVTANGRLVKLKTLTTAVDEAGGAARFETELPTPRDFNGELWGRVRYPDGEIRETERLQLAVPAKSEKVSSDETPRANVGAAGTNTAIDQSVDDNESARSDIKTGGEVGRSSLQPGGGGLRITVNVPAFLLTVWQGDKEVKSFYVGVGRRRYPIPTGMRYADRIVLNPDWIPPDSEWVRASGVEPYERIPAGSAASPLGKIKIPLGDAYLLHEAQGAADIGNLVSHGCVRVLRDDLFGLTRMIVAARGLPVPDEEISAARKDAKRRVIELGEELTVDINYDTMVVEGGVLSIYPDVYGRKTNTVEELRAELENYKIDVSKLDERTLKRMLDSVTGERKFVVPLDAAGGGRALEKGKTEPLTPFQAKKSAKKKSA